MQGAGPVIRLETHGMIFKCETVHIHLQELPQNRLSMELFREQPNFAIKMSSGMKAL